MKSSYKTTTAESVKFAQLHGYKYVGNGWFLPATPVATIGDFKRINDFSINERINLRASMQGLCMKHSIHVMTYFLKRWNQKHIYGRFLIDNKV